MPSANETRSSKIVPGARERLLRSRTEIIRLLSAVNEAGDPIVTELDDGELLFVSHILHLDPDNDSVTATWSPSKPANRLALEQKKLKFTSNHGGARLEFVGARPSEVEHDGRPALRFDLPKALLVLQRRSARRFTVPPRAKLRCTIAFPSGPVSAEVTDISLDGIGTLIHEPRVRLKPGTILKEVTIKHPDLGTISAGLEVRHSSRLRRRDGSLARRVGCRFVARPKDIDALVGLFVIDLEDN